MGLSDLIAGGMDATAATELLLNVVWTIIGATLVYFMQAGFAMCEAGFTRAKNTGNILMKNMMDFVLGSLFSAQPIAFRLIAKNKTAQTICQQRRSEQHPP